MMNLFTLIRIWKENVCYALMKHRNPIRAMDYRISLLEKSKSDLTIKSVPIFGREKQLDYDIQMLIKKIDADEDSIVSALKHEDRDLAKDILVRVKENKSKLESMQISLEDAKGQTKKLKDSIDKINQKIIDMKNERNSLDARYSSAKATQATNRIIAGIDPYGLSDEQIESKVREEEQLALGTQEVVLLNESTDETLDVRIKGLGNKSLDEELEAYKQRLK